jgi:DNA-binding winged helix-turn-helix (wHTH) protein
MNLPLAMPTKPWHEATEAALEFGDFRVLVRQRRLLGAGVPLELGARAFDILMVLIEADGALVAKDELQRRVWGDVVVSPDNLKVQIAALRKALGEDRGLILTDFGRGYRFTAKVRSTAPAPERSPEPGVASPRWPRHRNGLTPFLSQNAPTPAHRFGFPTHCLASGSIRPGRLNQKPSVATSGTVPGSSRPAGGSAAPGGSGRRSLLPRRSPIAGAPSGPASLVLARPA